MSVIKLDGATLIPSAEDPNKTYLEVGSIRYIFEDGVCIGWYNPELSRVVHKRSGRHPWGSNHD